MLQKKALDSDILQNLVLSNSNSDLVSALDSHGNKFTFVMFGLDVGTDSMVEGFNNNTSETDIVQCTAEMENDSDDDIVERYKTLFHNLSSVIHQLGNVTGSDIIIGDDQNITQDSSSPGSENRTSSSSSISKKSAQQQRQLRKKSNSAS